MEGEQQEVCNGGADGIRTHDLLDAIEARSQLRHGPTGQSLERFYLTEMDASISHCYPEPNPDKEHLPEG
jgi:hypothetical protein